LHKRGPQTHPIGLEHGHSGPTLQSRWPKANVGRCAKGERQKAAKAAEGEYHSSRRWVWHSGIIDFGADIGYFHWGKLL